MLLYALMLLIILLLALITEPPPLTGEFIDFFLFVFLLFFGDNLIYGTLFPQKVRAIEPILHSDTAT